MLARTHTLKKGDTFKYLGVEYIVLNIKAGRIYFKHLKSANGHGSFFGANSQAWIEIIKRKN